MAYPYTSSQILDVVAAKKLLRRPEVFLPGKPIPFVSYGARGKKIDLRLHVHAAVFDAPEMFEASLILAGQRVRGIGWHSTGKKRFYGKQIIPKGWHQNVVDPNLPPNDRDRNRHLPVKGFEPTDLAAFLTAAARLWHINLPVEESLL